MDRVYILSISLSLSLVRLMVYLGSDRPSIKGMEKLGFQLR